MLNNPPKVHLNEILARIDAASTRSTRKGGAGVTLVAVTKTIPLEQITPFIEAGVGAVGENRVQEAEGKWPGFGDKRPQLHLIGPLQTNKAKRAVALFDLIQTLDRVELAQDLNRHAQAIGKVQDCLVQIKISDEPTKSGLDPAALPEFLNRLKTFPSLRIQGLMGIPPLAASGDGARPYFQRLRRLFEEAKLNVLSMGMSSDFETAIEEGATMVRLGSALFGERRF